MELREFVLGLNGPYGKGEKGLKGWPHPSPWAGPNWTREGGRPLPSFSFSLPFPSLLLLLLGRAPSSTRKGGNPTPGGSRTPLGHAIERAGPPLLHSFIYGGRGHLIDTQVDLRIVP